MIELHKVQTIDGHRINCLIPSQEHYTLDASAYMLFPALIDPHVHFRTPGAEHKENWVSGAKAAIAGGVTTVLDMPNTTPSTTTLLTLKAKEQLVQKQLKACHIPLRAYFYLGADECRIKDIPESQDQIIALKIYMGSSTGSLLMSDPQALSDLFALAQEHDILIAVHAEDEALLKEHQKHYASRTDPYVHSLIRSPLVAARAVEQAIHLAQTHRTRLYIAHVSSQEELTLIRAAKRSKVEVYAEVTPHHLFLNDSAYASLGTKALVNPPLRSKQDQEALWEALHDGTLDTIGTDHAPHTLAEKLQPYPTAPSGFPSIEFYFALLLNAHAEGRLSLEEIVSLTHTRPQEIFRLPLNDDVVLADLSHTKTITESMIRSKSGWSPYLGLTLKGWPRYTICQGKFFDLERI